MARSGGPASNSNEPRFESRRVLMRFVLRMIIIVSVTMVVTAQGIDAASALHQLLLLAFYVCIALGVLRREPFNAPALNGMDESMWYLLLAVTVGWFVDPEASAGPR